MATQLAELDYNRSSRYIDGPKEDKFHARVTHNPSTAAPGEVLTVRVPKLHSDAVLFPNSLELVYDYHQEAGVTIDDIPEHLTAAIIDKYEIKINGRDILTIDNFNHYKIYNELWKSEEDYKNCKHRGIQTETERKQRHGLETPATAASLVYGKRYWFNLGHFLTDSAFTPQSIHNDIEIQLKFASGKYTIKNIHLEYDYIVDRSIAMKIKEKHDNAVYYIDGVHFSTAKSIPQAAGDFEINVHATYDSLRGILILYKEDDKVNTEFKNVNITKLKIDVDGRTNQVYSSDYQPEYEWMDANRYFKSQNPCHVDFDKFYTDAYGTFIDFRTIDNEKAYGVGRTIKDYVKLKATKGATPKDMKALVYLIYDKKVVINKNEVVDVVM